MPDSKNIIVHQVADLATGEISPEQITCTQYDRQAKLIAVHLKENGKDWTIPTGYRANVRMRKADGLYVYNTCTTSGNIAYITLTEQMCGVVGEQVYVLEVISGDHAVQSVTGRLKVIQNPIDDEEANFTSTPEYTTIQTAVADAQKAAQDAANAAQEVVDQNLSGYLKKSGGTMTGDVDMDGNSITGLADPTQEDEAARKGYVDDAAQKIDGILFTDPDDGSTYRMEFSAIDGYPAIQFTKMTN